MANINQIVGLKQIIANLVRATRSIEMGTEQGLKLAGLRLQKESQGLVPVDLGPLKASAYTRATGTGLRTVVYVGYTALYALHVHELIGMTLKGQLRTVPPGQPGYRGRFWDPQGKAQAKFLEEPARRLIPTLRTIIKNKARIP